MWINKLTVFSAWRLAKDGVDWHWR